MRITDQIEYNPEDGSFKWKVAKQGVKKGGVAGSINSEGYILIKIDGRSYTAHRLAFLWMGVDVPMQVDHVNHVRSDNRWCNLRQANNKINQKNRTINKNNRSGCSGVILRRKSKLWRAYISVNGVMKHLGQYTDWFDAVCARKAAERRYDYHGNHGQLNNGG